MNLFTEKTNNVNVLGFLKDGKTNISLELNSIISAEIISKNKNSVTALFNNSKKMEFNEGEIKGNVGDLIDFEVIEKKENTFVLKQIRKEDSFQREMKKQNETKNIKDLFDESKFTQEEKGVFEKLNDFIKEKIEENKAMSKFKRNLNYVKSYGDSNIVNGLISSGMSLEKIDLQTLKNAVKESAKENNTSNIEKIEESKVNINNKLEQIKNIDEKEIINILKENKDLTIENLYVNKYITVENKEVTKNTEEDFLKIKSQVEKFLVDEGFELSKENLNIAKLFISEKVDLTKENINKFKFLKEESINLEDLSEKIISNLKEEKSISDIDLYKLNDSKNILATYETLINFLGNDNENKINSLIEKEETISLINIYNEKPEKDILNSDSNKLNTVKKQLAEIQLKMTYEAIQRLADKNIDISVKPLEKALEHLVEVEKEYLAKNLQIMSAEVTPENIDTLWKINQKINTFQNISSITYKEIYENEIPFTINGVSKNIIDNYVSNETKVNPKFGDSYDKIRNSIPNALNNMEISVTEENINAFEILSRNKIDVTEENLNAIKVIANKIDILENKLHPSIASKMIKEGLNPLDMHVDEIIEYINKFNEFFGKSAKDNVAENIIKLERNKEINSETKDSVIGIYKALYQINKNNKSALGVLFNTEGEITMGNLLEASKYFSKSKMTHEIKDVLVNDEFGELEELKTTETNIRDRINRGIEKALENNNLEKEMENQNVPITIENIESFEILENYNSNKKDDLNKLHLLKDDINYLSEELNINYLENESNNSILEKTISQIKIENEKLSQNIDVDDIVKTNSIFREIASKEFFEKNSPRKLLWFEKNQISSLENISLANSLFENPNKIANELENLFDVNEIKDLKNINEKLEALENKKDISFEKVLEMQDLLSVQSLINKNSSLFSKQVLVSNKVTNLNMYIMDDEAFNKEEISALISLDTSVFGNVQFNLTKSNKNISLEINCENNSSLEKLKENKKFLENYLEEIGFQVDEIDFVNKKVTNYYENEIRNRSV